MASYTADFTEPERVARERDEIAEWALKRRSANKAGALREYAGTFSDGYTAALEDLLGVLDRRAQRP